MKQQVTDEEIIRRGVTGPISARASAVFMQRFRDNMAKFGYTPEQIADLERKASQKAKEDHAKLLAAFPDGDNHLSGLITPWGATHRMVRTESGEWTAVRNEPVNTEDRQKLD